MIGLNPRQVPYQDVPRSESPPHQKPVSITKTTSLRMMILIDTYNQIENPQETNLYSQLFEKLQN